MRANAIEAVAPVQQSCRRWPTCQHFGLTLIDFDLQLWRWCNSFSKANVLPLGCSNPRAAPMTFLQQIGPQAGMVTAALAWMGLVAGLSVLLRDGRGA
jgi:hypothetical protein